MVQNQYTNFLLNIKTIINKYQDNSKKTNHARDAKTAIIQLILARLKLKRLIYQIAKTIKKRAKEQTHRMELQIISKHFWHSLSWDGLRNVFLLCFLSHDNFIALTRGSIIPYTAFKIWTTDIRCVVCLATVIARTICGMSSVTVDSKERDAIHGCSSSSPLQRSQHRKTIVVKYNKVPQMANPKIQFLVLCTFGSLLWAISYAKSQSKIRSTVSETIMNNKKQVSFSLRILCDVLIYVKKESQGFSIILKCMPEEFRCFYIHLKYWNTLTISSNIVKLTGFKQFLYNTVR